MSTRSTIYYDGDSAGEFHLYQDGFEHWTIYLDVETEVAGARSTLTIPIPLSVWAKMRQKTTGCEKYLEMSAGELRQEAEKEIDARLTEWRARGSDPKDIMALLGIMAYGTIESPRDEQIESYTRWYTPPSPMDRKAT